MYGVTEKMFDELVDEDTKAEFLDGVMIVHSPASPRHNKIAGFLRNLMSGFAEEKEAGDVFGPDDLVHLATCRRFAADAFFIKQDRLPAALPEVEFEVVPDWMIEVLSSSNRDYDLYEKRPAYQEARVREIWLVDPEEEKILVDRLRGDRYVSKVFDQGKITSSALKGFWVETAWLWNWPLPKLLPCLRKILK
jgi:Uma2 family endonuclease